MRTNAWKPVFAGRCMEQPTVLWEKTSEKGSALRIAPKHGQPLELVKYNYAPPASEAGCYAGLDIAALLDSGKDLLAQVALQDGEPTYSNVRRLLPPVKKEAYGLLGSPAGWRCVLVLPDGSIVPQETMANRRPLPLFSPVEVDSAFGSVPPEQHLLDGWMPVSIGVHRLGGEALEIMSFVETGDTACDPLVWIRALIYEIMTGKTLREDFFAVTQSRQYRRSAMKQEAFWDAFVTCARFWESFSVGICRFDLPENVLTKCFRGAMVSTLITFSGDHAHYGHRQYGLEVHDNFPPNYLAAVEAFHAAGMATKARRVAEHLLAYGIDGAGRFAYRQGKEVYGASGSEYGQLFWLLDRLEPSLPPRGWIEPYLDTLVNMGKYLEGSMQECPECGGIRLVRMCAEADTNGRVHTYVSNNLWATRGFHALGCLLERYGRSEASLFLQAVVCLNRDIRGALRANEVGTRFGPLIPFRFGYTAEPLTLSTCRDTAWPAREEELKRYFVRTSGWDDHKAEQDLTENTYANYRYYLEMLSPLLLDESHAEAIVNMRENLGGEFLGMSRFFRWIDDWPVAHYARYLLASDRIGKYLLLLYAHIAHHGSPDGMVWYEQVNADGSVVAPGCLPSMLLVPMMLCWMFCFEPPGEQAIYLLRAIPTTWMQDIGRFGARSLGCSFGNADAIVEISAETAAVSLRLPPIPENVSVYVDLRLSSEIIQSDITEGGHYLERIERGYRLLLSAQAREKVHISVRRRTEPKGTRG